MFFSCVFMLVL